MSGADGNGSSQSMILPAPGSVSGKLSDVARDYFEAVRDELERAHWAGASGVDTAARFAACLDNLVRFLFETAVDRYGRRYARTRQQCAVFALGGYGRREQCPHSDVDLLILHSGGVTPFVETVTEALLYSLWDARLQVGHAVRNSAECVKLAAGDLTIKTSLLDGRFLCGSPELAGEYETSVRQKLATTDVDAFVTAKIAEARARQQKYGGTVFILEPNVKEGKGALRDLNHALWVARVKGDAADIEALKERDLVTAHEYEEMAAAREFLFRARSALHFQTRSKTEQLTFERQDAIGERFGYKTEGNNSAGDMFMRDYYHHAAVLSRTAGDIVNRLLAPPERTGLFERLVKQRTVRPGISAVGDRLVVDKDAIENDPVNLIAVFRDCQRLDLRLSTRSRELVRQNVERMTPEVAQSKGAVAAFFEILRGNEGVYEALAQMNRTGVLGRLIPEFGRLFCMVQHDYYHVYTVDQHSLVGVRELEGLRRGEYQQPSPFLTETMRGCDRPELLFLAMMFHDLGKGYGGDHDERGAIMVRDVADRLLMHEDDRAALEFLVRNHLLMSMLAQTRDIDDPELVLNFVKEVGTEENLTLLYLLTFADMRAVGPQIWNSWKDHLLAELYRRAVEVFETGLVSEADMESRAERARIRLCGRAVGEAEALRLKEFLASLPTSYFLGKPDDKIIDHWRLFESLGSSVFRHGVEHSPDRGFTEFTICTRDRLGLFRDLVAALTARGLNILTVKLVTTSNGWAVDVFRVAYNDQSPESSVDVWSDVADTLERILVTGVDAVEVLGNVLLNRVRRVGDRPQARRAPTRVEIDNDLAREFTVIDVYAGDRPGMLFLLADAMYRLGLNLHLAKVSTRLSAVLDVFYVTDSGRARIEDPARLEEIRRTIISALDFEEPQPALTALSI